MFPGKRSWLAEGYWHMLLEAIRWSEFGHSWRSTASKAWSAFDQKRLEPAEGSTNLSQVWKAGMLPVSMAGPWIKSSVQSLTLCGVRGLVAGTADCWVLFALELCSEDSGTWVQLASTISSSECSVSGDWSLLSVVTGVSESWGIPLHDLTCRPSPPALLKWRAHLGQISFGDSLSAVVICRMEQDFWCSIRPGGQSNDCWQRLQKVKTNNFSEAPWLALPSASPLPQESQTANLCH